jgi:hypothetical protein
VPPRGLVGRDPSREVDLRRTHPLSLCFGHFLPNITAKSFQGTLTTEIAKSRRLQRNQLCQAIESNPQETQPRFHLNEPQRRAQRDPQLRKEIRTDRRQFISVPNHTSIHTNRFSAGLLSPAAMYRQHHPPLPLPSLIRSSNAAPLCANAA